MHPSNAGGMMQRICDVVARTKRLVAKLQPDRSRDAATAGLSGERMPLGEEQGHLLLLDRRQCVLFCHDLTSYLLFLPGASHGAVF